MKVSKDDKMQIMEWAVELAKLEIASQRTTQDSETKRSLDILEGLKSSDKSPNPKIKTQEIVGTIYESLLNHIK